MEDLKILLCCGAGMSSGFLASSARKVAKKKKIHTTIQARSYSEVGELLGSIDVLLVGPHYAKDLEKLSEQAKPYHVAVALIPEDIYGSLDGERLLDLALETAKKK